MDTTTNTRNLFLILIGLVYMLAFASLYPQIPGLYGRNGIKPVHNTMQQMSQHNKDSSQTAESYFLKQPTLLWFMQMEPHIAMELLCVAGILISFLCMIWQRIRTMPTYFILWLLYLSLYKVGDTFLWFQWDILLLEVGFLTFLTAPVVYTTYNDFNNFTERNIHKQVPFWLVRWLLFRLMFASGVVKLTSRCPTWWGLTALNHHYESQCIPTPLAWWAHQLPNLINQLSVIATYIIEIGMPFLFFSPFRLHRVVAAYAQIFLMLMIYLTGNYNFFNILTAVMSLSLLDDDHLVRIGRIFTWKEDDVMLVTHRPPTRLSTVFHVSSHLTTAGVCAYLVSRLFTYHDKFQLNFNADDLQMLLQWLLPKVILVAAILFSLQIFYVMWRLLIVRRRGLIGFIGHFIRLQLIVLPSMFLFVVSMVPLSSLEPTIPPQLSPVVHKWHRATQAFELTHTYGLFRSMTGVGGRPEVVVEGGDSMQGPWKEYEFYYKPGNRTRPLTWPAPHQPRLDWQMWFAALSSYQHNPWILSLVHRLLLGQPEVLDLMDRSRNPFPHSPPKYIRAQLYHYHFTKLSGSKPTSVWSRKLQREYIPPVAKDNVDLLGFLRHHRIMPLALPKKRSPPTHVTSFLATIRSYTTNLSPPALIWALVLTAMSISYIGDFLEKTIRRKRKEQMMESE